jgi:hypothetical protein
LHAEEEEANLELFVLEQLVSAALEVEEEVVASLAQEDSPEQVEVALLQPVVAAVAQHHLHALP